MTGTTAYTAPAEDRSRLDSLFDGVAAQRIPIGELAINTRVLGSGPPVLLLHGYPENHLMWAEVAPVLARTHTVVVADLRGYGDSDKPAPTDPGVYAKRAMATDALRLMAELGFDTFAVIAHDRGARVAHRLVLDRPETVSRLALLDIVPTRHVFGNVDRALATAYFHWFFLSTGHGIPERLINADPAFWVRSLIAPLLGPGARIAEPVLADYVRCFRDPATVAATCADYRAGASIDLEHDDATFASGQRIEVPMLALWGAHSFVGWHYDPLTVWQDYARDVRGSALPAGHFLAEENPRSVTAALVDWLA